jgi:hypothetical protein
MHSVRVRLLSSKCADACTILSTQRRETVDIYGLPSALVISEDLLPARDLRGSFVCIVQGCACKNTCISGKWRHNCCSYGIHGVLPNTRPSFEASDWAIVALQPNKHALTPRLAGKECMGISRKKAVPFSRASILCLQPH